MATRISQRLIKDARANNPLAQLNLGKLYLFGGEGLAANHDAALHWLSRAAQAGMQEAALLIAERIPVEHVGVKGTDYLSACRQAAALGSAAAHCNIGDSLAATNLHAAFDAYCVAAENGYVPAARKLALLLVAHPELDYDQGKGAKYWLNIAAAAGDRQSIHALADLLWRAGDIKAEKWLEIEATSGETEAMYRLGELLYVQGKQEGGKRAAYWFEKAARKAHARALWRYGRLHVRLFSSTPTGLPHSPLQAARLLERAAALGVPEAIWDLARIYEMPGYSKRCLARAREYLERAARAGVLEAELELGRRLAKYKNDQRAWLDAGVWLSRAAERGSIEASVLLMRISDHAPEWPADRVVEQEKALGKICTDHPIIAARLGLAACFGLSTREMLFIDPIDAEQKWCLNVDLSKHFKYKPWRLVAIDTLRQRQALKHARETFLTTKASVLHLGGATTRDRARKLELILTSVVIAPSLFLRDWKSQWSEKEQEFAPTMVARPSHDFAELGL